MLRGAQKTGTLMGSTTKTKQQDIKRMNNPWLETKSDIKEDQLLCSTSEGELLRKNDFWTCKLSVSYKDYLKWVLIDEKITGNCWEFHGLGL